MNKIIKAALTATFPGINIDAILEVINATQNPVIATEKLIGVFEEPVLKQFWNRKGDRMRVLKCFTWNVRDDDQVEYNYNCEEKTERWLKPSDSAIFKGMSDINNDERVSFLNTHGKYKREGEFTDSRECTVIKNYRSSCSVALWIEFHGDEPSQSYVL